MMPILLLALLQDPGLVPEGYAIPHPVSVHKDAPREVLAAADRWGRSFHQGEAWRNERNAVCVIWLEVDRSWMPFPDVEAYSIYSHIGGTIVRATSPAQLDAALKDLQSRLKVVKGRTFLPLGFLTNLPSMK